MKQIDRVLGPYLQRSSGRYVVTIHYSDGTKKGTKYARYLMEQHLGRELTSAETVDHINEDRTDDRIENLQILSWEEHRKKTAQSQHRPTEVRNCANCGISFTLLVSTAASRISASKSGNLYCSRSCTAPHVPKRKNPNAIQNQKRICTCMGCGGEFFRNLRIINQSVKRKSDNFFCSSSCYRKTLKRTE